MTAQLRISKLIVTTELVWDDGQELTPGPQLQPVAVPLSQLAGFGQTLPDEVAALSAKLLAELGNGDSAEH
jgi:hypothetical protein